MNEGGFKLTNNANDRGGLTYAGISRNRNPAWEGWAYIDKSVPPVELVRKFYKENFWDAVRGDEISDQSVAENLFDFAVNCSPKSSVKLSQISVSVVPDGVLGPKSLEAINSFDPTLFKALFALAKIAYYRDIVNRHPNQLSNFKGWVNRTLEMAS